MTDTKKLSPRWAGTSAAARRRHMSGLASIRMARLGVRARRAIALKLVAARRAKHDQKNHA